MSNKKQNNDTNNSSTSSDGDVAGLRPIDTQVSVSQGDLDIPVYDEDTRDLVDASDRDAQKAKRPINVRVAARQGESTEQMLRRFNYAVQDVVQKMRDLQYYEKPSQKRRREEKLRIQQVHRYEKFSN